MQVTILFPNVLNTTPSCTFRVTEMHAFHHNIQNSIKAWGAKHNHPIDLLTTHRLVQVSASSTTRVFKVVRKPSASNGA